MNKLKKVKKVIVIFILSIIIILFIYKKRNSTKKNVFQQIENNDLIKFEMSNKREKDSDLFFFLNNSIGYFSQAKTEENAKNISKLIANKEINSETWKQLKNKILEIIPDYNVNVLQSEYSTFYGMAQCYERWQQIQEQKSALPFLKYSAVNDNNICKTCKKLNNIIRNADDPFWDIYFPPNCQECRCTVEQYDAFDVKKITDLTNKNLIKPTDKFAINIGKHELLKNKY